jgi:hypothetical protein
MKQVQWFDSRFYKVLTRDGIDYYPSVTTILQAAPKPFLAKWRGDVGTEEADRVMNEGRRRGTTIHSACEILIKGGVVVLDGSGYDSIGEKEISEIERYRKVVRIKDQEHFYQVLKFKTLLETLMPSRITTEQTVYSTQYRYAGTMDYLFWLGAGRYEIDGAKPVFVEEGWYIGDLKTGNSISDDYFMQLGAYRQAVVEHQGLDIKGGLIIHTNSSTKKGIEGLSVKLHTAAELDADFNNFLKVYDVWNINPTAAAPRVFTMPNVLQWTPAETETAPTQDDTAAEVEPQSGPAPDTTEASQPQADPEPAPAPAPRAMADKPALPAKRGAAKSEKFTNQLTNTKPPF